MYERLHSWLIKKVFNRIYRGYEYPYKTADTVIGNMGAPARLEYYREAKTIIGGQVILTELAETRRHFMEEIALRATTLRELDAYRQTLIFIRDFETRLRFLASRAMEDVVHSEERIKAIRDL